MTTPTKRFRVRNRRALATLIIVSGYLAWGGWLLWQAQRPGSDPPPSAFLVISIAILFLLDDDYRYRSQ